MDFTASLGITIALWALVGALTYGVIRLLFYIQRFKKTLWFSGFLFMWYLFVPHVGVFPDIGACPADTSACSDLSFATFLFLFPAIGIAMIAAQTRFGWFDSSRVAPYHLDGATNEDDLGIMRRLIPVEVIEKRAKHVSIFTAGRRTPKKVKGCPICKRNTRCRIGINPFGGVSFHTIRE